MAKESLTGILSRIKWRSADEGNDFVFAELRTGETIAGQLPEQSVTIGLTYSFRGEWKPGKPYNGKPQKAFWFDQYAQSEPHTRQGVSAYLQKYAPGIGPTLSGRLFDAFGEDAAKILRTDPERAAREVNGLAVEIAREAAGELQKNIRFESVRIDLAELFAGRGFSSNLPGICVQKWGIYAAKRIRRDPFCLLVAEIASCGFLRCDSLYLALGLKPWRLKRLMLCIWHMIRTDMEGHTWHDGRKIIEKLRQSATVLEDVDSLSSTDKRINRAIELGVRAEWLSLHRDSSGKVWIAEGEAGKNEQTIAECIARLTHDEPEETEEAKESRLEFLIEAKAAEEDSFVREISESISEAQKRRMIFVGRETGICQFCQRELTNEESRDRGYGPVCAANHGLPWGENHDSDPLSDSGVSRKFLENCPL